MSTSVNTAEETPLNGNNCSSDVEEIELQVSNQRKEEKQVSAEKDGKIVWRIANGLMTAFFLMAAGVQFNDPDPFLWVPLYGIAALLTLSITIWPNSSGDKKWTWIYWIHAVYCLTIFVYVIIELAIAAANPLSDGSLNPLTYEEGREMAGVMITAVWLFTCKQSPIIRTGSSQTSRRGFNSTSAFVVLFSLLPLLLWSVCQLNIVDCSLCTDFYDDKFSF